MPAVNARPAPAVIQNVYFPTPQSVNVGAVFSPRAEQDGTFALYASGGVENKIWVFRFRPGANAPIAPASPGPNTSVEAPFIDVNGFATSANSPRYNGNYAPVYPTGLAISPDGDTLYVANNLGDSLGIISNMRNVRDLTRVDLHRAGSGRWLAGLHRERHERDDEGAAEQAEKEVADVCAGREHGRRDLGSTKSDHARRA
jgi:hypothetical protein